MIYNESDWSGAVDYYFSDVSVVVLGQVSSWYRSQSCPKISDRRAPVLKFFLLNVWCAKVLERPYSCRRSAVSMSSSGSRLFVFFPRWAFRRFGRGPSRFHSFRGSSLYFFPSFWFILVCSLYYFWSRSPVVRSSEVSFSFRMFVIVVPHAQWLCKGSGGDFSLQSDSLFSHRRLTGRHVGSSFLTTKAAFKDETQDSEQKSTFVCSNKNKRLCCSSTWDCDLWPFSLTPSLCFVSYKTGKERPCRPNPQAETPASCSACRFSATASLTTGVS